MDKKFLASAAVAAISMAGMADAGEGATADSVLQQLEGGFAAVPYNDGFKCYGTSLKGKNSCGDLRNTHSCAGQSSKDNDIAEWTTADSAAECAAKWTAKEVAS